MHRRYARAANARFELEVEIRCVDAHERCRTLVHDPLGEAPTQRKQPRQLAQHLGVAAYRQFADVVPGFAAGGDHAIARHTRGASGAAATQRLDHRRRQEIAGRLACNESEPQGVHRRRVSA